MLYYHIRSRLTNGKGTHWSEEVIESIDCDGFDAANEMIHKLKWPVTKLKEGIAREIMEFLGDKKMPILIYFYEKYKRLPIYERDLEKLCYDSPHKRLTANLYTNEERQDHVFYTDIINDSLNIYFSDEFRCIVEEE